MPTGRVGMIRRERLAFLFIVVPGTDMATPSKTPWGRHSMCRMYLAAMCRMYLAAMCRMYLAACLPVSTLRVFRVLSCFRDPNCAGHFHAASCPEGHDNFFNFAAALLRQRSPSTPPTAPYQSRT